MKKKAAPDPRNHDEDDAPILTPELLAKGKATVYPRPQNGSDISIKDGVVTVKAVRGGPRIGAGRKPTGHVPLRLSVSPVVRKRIESVAKQRNMTLSAVVEEAFGPYNAKK